MKRISRSIFASRTRRSRSRKTCRSTTSRRNATARPASTRFCATRTAAIRASRSTRRTAFTAKPATSRIRRRTSTGPSRRGAAVRITPTCEPMPIDRAALTRHPFRNLRRRLALAVLLGAAAALPLASCGAGDSGGSAGERRMMAGFGSGSGSYRLSSPYGSFLAARHARELNDNTAAANYYMRALKEDADNAMLAQGAFLALLADGRVAEAVALTPALRSHNPADYLPRMTQAAA